MNTNSLLALVPVAAAITACSAQPHGAGGPPAGPIDWQAEEAPFLSGHVQLTTDADFHKAGEAYFSPDARWIIFQAMPVPAEGEAPDIHYSMYAARLTHDAAGNINGITDTIQLSNPGSANTCGWFHPRDPWVVLYGSTIHEPTLSERSGFQVKTRKYIWMFPEEMEIVSQSVPKIWESMPEHEGMMVGWTQESLEPTRVFSRPGYDAEGSWAPNQKSILYANVDPEKAGPRPDADIWSYDIESDLHYPLVVAPGYDGGPFFSADGQYICYRSDRQQNDLLQLFISELEYKNGVPVGITREVQITDNEHVNWAPFWHPSGEYLVYGTSQVGHWNYEVFAVEVGPYLRGETSGSDLPEPQRITNATGADVLPVFSPDGSVMMWTSQRLQPGQGKGQSHLWVANVNGSPLTK